MATMKLPTITPKSKESEENCLKCVSVSTKVKSPKKLKRRHSSSTSKTISNIRHATISADFNLCPHQKVKPENDAGHGLHLDVSKSGKISAIAPYENPSLVVLGFEVR